MQRDIDIVVKIGSMALIDKTSNDIDYNVLSRVSRSLKPGYALVTSGAVEVGRVDYIKRRGQELEGEKENIKADYSAQGQAILMSTYRQFLDSRYSLRQILVEHQHFNDLKKRDYLEKMLKRCKNQNAIPIINYNDAISNDELSKMEVEKLRKNNNKVVECVDNDETASQIACLLKPKYLIILTSVDGIYAEFGNEDSLIENIEADNIENLIKKINEAQAFCIGSSREGANGARAKLEYLKEPIRHGISVIIGNSKYKIEDLINKKEKCTTIQVR